MSHVSHLSANISPLAVVDHGSVSSASDTPYSPGSDVPDTPTLSSYQFDRLCKCVKYTSRAWTIDQVCNEVLCVVLFVVWVI